MAAKLLRAIIYGDTVKRMKELLLIFSYVFLLKCCRLYSSTIRSAIGDIIKPHLSHTAFVGLESHVGRGIDSLNRSILLALPRAGIHKFTGDA